MLVCVCVCLFIVCVCVPRAVLNACLHLAVNPACRVLTRVEDRIVGLKCHGTGYVVYCGNVR